ncbi:hypothetical protein IscW_ISCW007211 [Ixodes scapularis]|uniref:Uncharacterized protein n=1 Tax=Ixodes scapularis TaxID=6945 RepID=B7PST1_IXOSC|nr:hypothetical protein IscW_ISCW007211 [Ixodes scapularis]|eukprot:XP_002402945.1 hypothetical protein IscW_ISCW007211 [Ixodes scapularis]
MLVMEAGDNDLASVIRSATEKEPMNLLAIKFYWSEMLQAMGTLNFMSPESIARMPGNGTGDCGLKRCLRRNPRERPTISELLQHPFLTEDRALLKPQRNDKLQTMFSEIENMSPDSVKKVNEVVWNCHLFPTFRDNIFVQHWQG